MLNKLTKFKQTEIGPIPEEWDVKVLGDLLSFEYGKALKESGRSGDNFPVYGSNGVVGFHDEFLVKGPGIVVGRKGSAGEVIFANQDFYPIDTTYFVKTKEDLKYIFYLLKTLDLKSLVSSSAVPGLNRNDAYSLPITIPNSENEQTQIAEILSSLDDKIELNREMNKTLEEFGQAIFKRWFVGFEFPNSQGLPYKSSGGEMIKSELGEIPKEWSAGVLSEIVNNVNDRYNGDNLVDKFPYVPIDIISSKTLTLGTTAPYEDAQSSLLKFKKNDILFGAMRPYFHKVTIAPFSGLTRTTCFVLRPVKEYCLSFTLYKIFQEETVDFATSSSEGSTIPYAKWNKMLSEMKMIIPTEDVLKQFNSLIYPVVEKIRDSHNEISNLSQIRDLLLPRLMSGKIRVNLYN